MILLERNESFLMVTQQDHAKLSGEIASNWKQNYFAGIERKDDVIQAIYEHDRCWIELTNSHCGMKRNNSPTRLPIILQSLNSLHIQEELMK